MAIQVYQANGAAVIPQRRMVHERNLVGLRRKTDVADPAVAFIERVANRVFNSITSLNVVNDGKFAIYIPVCPRNVFEHLTGRPSGKRSTGKHALRLQMCPVNPVERNSEFARARNGKQ